MNVKLKVNSLELSKKEYESLIIEVDKSIFLTIKERKMLLNSPVAYAAANLPYICEQDFPDQKAVLTINNIIIATRNKNFFASRKQQTINDRINLCLVESGGNRELATAYKLYFELASLEDHKHDLANDINNNYPNPLVNEIDYYKTKEAITQKMELLSARTKEILDECKLDNIITNYWF